MSQVSDWMMWRWYISDINQISHTWYYFMVEVSSKEFKHYSLSNWKGIFLEFSKEFQSRVVESISKIETSFFQENTSIVFSTIEYSADAWKKSGVIRGVLLSSSQISLWSWSILNKNEKAIWQQYSKYVCRVRRWGFLMPDHEKR